jgi:hypothetical protein
MSNNVGGRAQEDREEEQAEEVDNVTVEAIRQCLRGRALEVGKKEDENGIFANARSFVRLSRENSTVHEVVLYLHEEVSILDYRTLLVLGELFGNLKALRFVTILSVHGRRVNGRRDEGYGDGMEEREVVESLYQQAVAGALRRIRIPFKLHLDGTFFRGGDFKAFKGLSTIRTFYSADDAVSCGMIAYVLMDVLASLPSLEDVILGRFRGEAFSEEAPDPDFSLLESPSLRSIEFSQFHITSGVSQALFAAFKRGSSVTNLVFTQCYIEHEDGAEEIDTLRTLVLALQMNSSVNTLSIVGNDFFNGLFCDGITTALVVNTTLIKLRLRVPSEEGGRWLQPLFGVMRINTSLKSLDVNDFHLTDELVCGALRDALATNSALESLTLHCPQSLDETSLLSWRKTLPFLRSNATLKSLTISLNGDLLNSQVAPFCSDTVAMLQGNTTLECLVIRRGGIGPDAYFAALESLQSSSVLKTLRLSAVLTLMGEKEMNQVVSLVKKNYSLVNLDVGLLELDKTGELGTLLRLNQAGRCYLIKDAASIAKGVEVLIGVSDNLGCLFYHLLNNPTLCDIEI